MDEIKWLEVAVNTTPDAAGRGDRQADRRGHDRAGHRGRGGVPAVSGAEPAVLGLCGPGADGPDAGGHPGEVLRHRRRRRPGAAGAVHPGPGRGAHRHPPDGQRLGVQLAEVLQAPGDRPSASTWCPSGCGTSPSRRAAAPLYLNPGLTFGTGSHASTQLCLEGVEEHTLPGRPVLDLGCGSGILSIAALCLGASTAAAVDIDPKAVDVAYENAALNGIGRDRYTVRAGDVLSDRALAAELARQRYHPGAGQHRGRRDHPPVRPGPRPAGGGRGVPVLRHHRHPRPRGGGTPWSARG